MVDFAAMTTPEKEAHYQATVGENMRMVREYYAERYGNGSVRPCDLGPLPPAPTFVPEGWAKG